MDISAIDGDIIYIQHLRIYRSEGAAEIQSVDPGIEVHTAATSTASQSAER